MSRQPRSRYIYDLALPIGLIEAERLLKVLKWLADSKELTHLRDRLETEVAKATKARRRGIEMRVWNEGEIEKELQKLLRTD